MGIQDKSEKREEYIMDIGGTIKVRTNSNGWVDAELLEERDTTIKVKLLHDGNIITRKKKRDLRDEEAV